MQTSEELSSDYSPWSAKHVAWLSVLFILVLCLPLRAQRFSRGVFLLSKNKEKYLLSKINVVKAGEKETTLSNCQLDFFIVQDEYKGKNKFYKNPEKDKRLQYLGTANTNSLGILRFSLDFGMEYVIDVKKHGYYRSAFIFKTELYEYSSRFKSFDRYECNYSLFPSLSGNLEEDPEEKIRMIEFNPLVSPPKFTISQRIIARIDSAKSDKQQDDQNKILPASHKRDEKQEKNVQTKTNKKKFFISEENSSGYVIDKDTFNLIDRNIEKQGVWRFEAGYLELNESDPSRLLITGNYENNLKTGTWKRYYEDEKVQLELPFFLNQPSGEYKIYSPGGQLKADGNFHKKSFILEGSQKTYYENGRTHEHLQFNKDGKKEGVQVVFFSTGGLAIVAEMKGDLLDGDITLFNESGLPIMKKKYKLGQLISEQKIGTSDAAIIKTLDSLLAGLKDAGRESQKIISGGMEEINRTEKDYDTILKEREQDLLVAQIKLNLQGRELIKERRKMSRMELLVKLQNEETKQQRNLAIGISVFSILILIILLLVVNSFREKTRINKELQEKNQKILHQQKEIEDSINYAAFIQKSLLPEPEIIQNIIGNFCLFFQPKDIVSGDFLWSEIKDGNLFLGVADCTGHGIPGAMVSMLASEKLSEGLKQEDSPGKILSYCNRSFNRTFRQKGSQSESKDGMDIGLIKIKKNAHEFTFAGANRPLWIISQTGEFTDVKPNKMGIGGNEQDDFEYQEFTTNYQAGSALYLFSDGYADQFSEADKKMMTKRLRELLISNHRLSMDQQREIISAFFHQWKGSAEQTDDVLLIGIRL